MSDADTPERTVTEAGIAVTKSYETDEFPVPTVDFRVRSERDDGVTVRLADAIPDGVPSGDLGFHPDYGGDDWSLAGDNAVFKRSIAPGEEYRTIYGIRTDDHDPDRFMTDPELTVDAPEGSATESTDTGAESTDTDEPTAPGRDSSQAARDVITGDREVAGLDGDDTVEDVTISGNDPATADGPASGGTNTDRADAGRDVPEGGVGAALAAELRDGDLAESDRQLLAAEFDTDDTSGEVRFSHLQSRISDLEAYTDALEEFIDENGPARRLIEDLTDDIERIEDELAALDERTEANERAIERLDGDVEANADDIEALDKGLADAEAEIDETQASIADLRRDIDEIDEWRGRISSVLGGVSDEE